jgi:hypothetical protein
MNSLVGSLVAVVLALAGLQARPAAAGILVSATWTTEVTSYSGASTIAVPVLATGSSTDSAIAVSLTLPSFEHTSIHQPAPPVTLILPTYRRLTLGGAQTIVATAGMASADAGIEGLAQVRLAQHVARGANASMSVPRTTLFLFPLRAGVDGRTTNFFYAAGGSTYVVVDFYGWTAQTQTFTGLTLVGVALPSVKVGGSFALTAQGGGTVTLVAPTRIAIDATSPTLAQQRTVSVSTLKLTFVPEPRMLALAVVGVACLLVLRRRGGA